MSDNVAVTISCLVQSPCPYSASLKFRVRMRRQASKKRDYSGLHSMTLKLGSFL